MAEGREQRGRSPTGLTTKQPEKRSRSRQKRGTPSESRKSLLPQFSQATKGHKTGSGSDSTAWSRKEELALVRYVMKQNYIKEWPKTKRHKLWQDPSICIHNEIGLTRTRK